MSTSLGLLRGKEESVQVPESESVSERTRTERTRTENPSSNANTNVSISIRTNTNTNTNTGRTHAHVEQRKATRQLVAGFQKRVDQLRNQEVSRVQVQVSHRSICLSAHQSIPAPTHAHT
jgi:hypothetical protein